MVVAISRDKRGWKWPIGEETVISDVEGFGFVAEVMLAPFGLLGILIVVTLCCGGLVGAGIVDVGRLGVTRCDQVTVFFTSVCITSTSLFSRLTCSTRALCAGQEADGILMPTAHPRACFDQLAVRRKGEATFWRITGKS